MFPLQYNAASGVKKILLQFSKFCWVLRRFGYGCRCGFITEFILGLCFFEIISVGLLLKLLLKNATLKDNTSFPSRRYCSIAKYRSVSKVCEEIGVVSTKVNKRDEFYGNGRGFGFFLLLEKYSR